MNPFALVVFAGASCLLVTYNLSRGGNILLALLVIAFIGATSGAIAIVLCGEKNIPRVGSLLSAFVIGAMLGEVGVFANYYITYGYQDPKLSVGIAVSIIEFGVISVTGVLALLIATSAMKSRITRRLSRSRGQE